MQRIEVLSFRNTAKKRLLSLHILTRYRLKPALFEVIRLMQLSYSLAGSPAAVKGGTLM